MGLVYGIPALDASRRRVLWFAVADASSYRALQLYLHVRAMSIRTGTRVIVAIAPRIDAFVAEMPHANNRLEYLFPNKA